MTKTIDLKAVYTADARVETMLRELETGGEDRTIWIDGGGKMGKCKTRSK